MTINWKLKGTRLNPYDWNEFPEHHFIGISQEKKALLKKVWDSNPQIWESEQPNFELLFELANREIN
ncbi:hypothetical protein F7734_10100 [Scytonema sp. UIC 10036]|uniref:hypothetical protein n=1 Tax=Scytonema sp. UIC 10036 TaxID=2304196 RepID=UPI0012DA0625|nr:hypothetical protein [Scytonema sp. UIC 10036]MUG92783.1 hypothetical protein [Scytonema sp. UIC 10036]